MKYLSILLITFLVACSSGSDEKKEENNDEKDSTETSDSNTVDTEEVLENPEDASIEEIEKTGEGMTFCECVKIMDSLEALSFEVETDAETEAILNEMGKLRDGDCKVLKAGGQDSPEERAARKQKAAACK